MSRPFFLNMQTISNIEITTPTDPDDWALSLADAKLHLNILDNSFDDLIIQYLNAAHTMLFQETNILVKGELKGVVMHWDNILLNIGYIDTVVLKYWDDQEVLTTYNDYFMTKGKITTIEPKTDVTLSERLYPIELEITTKPNTNELIRQAIRMIVADLFESRQTNAAGSFAELSRTTAYQLGLISLRTFL